MKIVNKYISRFIQKIGHETVHTAVGKSIIFCVHEPEIPYEVKMWLEKRRKCKK